MIVMGVGEDKPYWVAFSVFVGIGPERFKILLDYFGSAKQAWEANRLDLLDLKLGDNLVERLVSFRGKFEPESYFEKLKQKKIGVLTLAEDSYPFLLKQIPDPPPVLYILGDQKILNSPSIAVVGTRKMTDYGAKITVLLVQGLVEAGLCIVSGLAYGVDTLAHSTALSNQGKTVAVLGCGVDICYPEDHLKVYQEIIGKGGAIVAEVPPGITTKRGIFVARNRIISGLSAGVLVIEGTQKSGTLITAAYAASQGREVFAVPGPITSVFSNGPNLLIKEGAKMVTSVNDILTELKGEYKIISSEKNSSFPREIVSLRELLEDLDSDEERKVLAIFDKKSETLYIDEIIRQTGLDSGKVASTLSLLEVKGIIKDYGGKYGIY